VTELVIVVCLIVGVTALAFDAVTTWREPPQ